MITPEELSKIAKAKTDAIFDKEMEDFEQLLIKIANEGALKVLVPSPEMDGMLFYYERQEAFARYLKEKGFKVKKERDIRWALCKYPTVFITKYKAKADEKMKIYHTETQEDYDALMVELEEQGYVWTSGRKPTESKDWIDHKENTCVEIREKISRTNISFFKFEYPEIPIIKYKAKDKDRMKFTRQNVLNQMDGWMNEPDSTVEDLMRRITALEYVTIPLFVADWLESKKRHRYSLRASIDVDWQLVPKEIKDWVSTGTNDEVFARAWLDGYNIEKEQLYHVLNTEGQFLLRKYDNKVGGMRLSATVTPKDIGSADWFLLTEREIKNYDERFWTFAVPVEE